MSARLLATETPEQAVQILQQGAQSITDAGGTPTFTTASLEALKAGDPNELQMVKNVASVFAPDIAKSMRGDQTKFEQGAGVMQGFTFNPSTGAFTADPAMIERLRKDAEQKAKTEGILKGKDLASINDKVTGLTKDVVSISESASSLDALKGRGTPAAQLAAVFKFMKALDPGSVVREDEQNMAVATGGAADSLVGMVNSMIGEGKLSDAVFSDFVNTAKQLANASISATDATVKDYLAVLDENLTNKNMTQLFGPRA